MKQHILEIKKFLLIGGISTIINYGLFYVLFTVGGIAYIVSAIAGYVIGLLFGYFFNRMWTFESTNSRKVHEFSKYLLVYMISLIFSMLFLAFLVEYVAIDALIANVFAIGLSTVMNFVGCKLVVFRKVRL